MAGKKYVECGKKKNTDWIRGMLMPNKVAIQN